MVTLNARSYFGWPNTQFLSNGTVELILTADVGPRILSFALEGGPNVMKLFAEQLGQVGDSDFRAYGGHRLWHAPESIARTYTPDNSPLQVEPITDGVRVTMPADSLAGIEKAMAVTLAQTGATATVRHTLTNRTLWPVTLAPWALSQVTPGGMQIVPLPPYEPHGPDSLLPTHTFTLWSYTNFADPRWRLSGKYVTLRQDPAGADSQKFGLTVPAGWCAYAFQSHLFVKRFAWDSAATYPDRGVNYETYTDSDMLELETLGPLTTLAPGESVSHVEHWALFGDVAEPKTDADIMRDVLPRALSVPPVNV